MQQKKGMGAERMGIRNFGKSGIYACDHLIGKSIERSISEHVVKMESCVDVNKTCRSRTRQCQTKMILSMSKQENRSENGRLTQAIGWLCGGDQIFIIESKMLV
mmetsp:Transcript_25251/g.28330  ORF Transcript_25251/g.28330 Transcript_25251/m.28330 type:complete len:104 (+) Transcript_25251:2805-3116(+)